MKPLFQISSLLMLVMTQLFVVNAFAADPVIEEKAQVLKNQLESSLFKSSVIISAIKEQNSKHASLSEADIDTLDKQWRAETKADAKPLIDSVMNNATSAELRQIKGSNDDLYKEIFIMDNKGLNVGSSDETSDYMQGDEAKWQQSFGAGKDAIHIGDVELDESTQEYLVQLSYSISDPADGSVIGAVTIGVDVDNLKELN